MKRIAAGILAHVDAGKTTLSEGLLFCAGTIRSLGRVDERNTFLDTNETERRRGITIFSKQAIINAPNATITLLDTPGHTDFAAEAERTLGVLDYAILVVSATEGVQSHTKTIWDMLLRKKIPTFVFINKIDLTGADKGRVIEELKSTFDANFVDFSDSDKESFLENAALCDEALMQEYLSDGKISDEKISDAIQSGNIYPCFCGSALKNKGVEEFFDAFLRLTKQKAPMTDFGARIFKIAEDDRKTRLTFMKITGGELKVKDSVETAEGAYEKINEIRIYSGEKFSSCDRAEAGCVCAVTGLKQSFSGQGLGFEKNSEKLTAEPIFSYRVILQKDVSVSDALACFRRLGEEETSLNVGFNERLGEIEISLMGEIQLEVLKQTVKSRFGFEVELEESGIIYKETIAAAVEGVGHYEPLRHYAEVHLLIEPMRETRAFCLNVTAARIFLIRIGRGL